jgi:anti-repressor protein
MNELIKIEHKNGIETVNARELHRFLEVKQRFNDWIKFRIEKYGFEEDVDYISLTEKIVSGNNANARSYHISLDMAKELSMVENNEKGRQARQYFIECEKRSTGLVGKNQIDNSRIERLENMVEKLITSIPMIISETVKSISNNYLKQAEYTQDYFSIIGYANHKGIKINFSEALNFGKEAVKISKANNLEIRKIPDERFGRVNSYSIRVLEKIFEI